MTKEEQQVAWESQQIYNIATGDAIRILNERTKGLTGISVLILIAAVLAVIF